MEHEIEDLETSEISISQRLAGFGAILLGAFSMYYCLSFLDDLWNTPSRTAAIAVTVTSALVMLFGTAIGYPEFLPKKIVSFTIFVFGLLTTLIGVMILVWFCYNILIARQKEFLIGNPAIAILMVSVGFGISLRYYRKLRRGSKMDFHV